MNFLFNSIIINSILHKTIMLSLMYFSNFFFLLVQGDHAVQIPFI